jgi:oxalyl-CoA decarboxylase
VILGKGAAYAQADAEIKAFVEKSGIPYLPMSMAKGLLPDNHNQSASAARSYVLAEADVVMLVGARLNWLLSHGKGKTWGAGASKEAGKQQFIQVDISPTEADSNVAIAAPVIGDIGSCISAFNQAMGSGWSKPPADWTGAIAERKDKNLTKMAETLAKNPPVMNFHSALNVIRDTVKDNPKAYLVNEGANALDFTRSIVDMYEPRRRLDVGTWGHHGHRHGLRRRGLAAVTGDRWISGGRATAPSASAALDVSRPICRDNLPVCHRRDDNNGGIYKGTDVTRGATRWLPTQFVKNAPLRHDDAGLRRRRRSSPRTRKN